jgi:hypothetical protein
MHNIAGRLGAGKAEVCPKSEEFVSWGVKFFSYLVRDKSSSNVRLRRLIYCLGDDGRQELALSIFNFLRRQVWKDFCQERKSAKQDAKKNLFRAKSDLRKARTAYTSLLESSPELKIWRLLGDDRRLHLSDILEMEADFLLGQGKIERNVTRRTGQMPCRGSSSTGRTNTMRNLTFLSSASAALRDAATSYRALLTLTEMTVIGNAFVSFPPAELVSVLKSEEAYVARVMGRVNPAFNKKRLGVKEDLSILIRLGYFVELFGLRWHGYLPPEAATTLRESDIGDLLEAARSAMGVKETFNAESIGRALERFTQRESNQQTCQILRKSAQDTCDGLKLQPPLPTGPLQRNRL